MGQIVFPERIEVKGPWLLNQDDFESLHDIIEKIDRLLYQSWENNIANEIQEANKDMTSEELAEQLKRAKTKSWYNKHEKTCIITSKDDTKLSDDTIYGLLKDKNLDQFKPKSFNVNIRHGGLLENNFDFKLSNLFRGSLEYNLKCTDSSIKGDIQYEINKWIDKRKPNKALNIWSNYGDFITLMFFFFTLFFAYQTSNSSYISYNESIRLELYELGQTGINDNNRDLAIELLVKHESGYMPIDYKPVEKKSDPKWLKFLVGSIFIFITSFFRPKTMIGLGKQKSKLYYMKIWIKFIIVTVPTVVFIAPFWEYITQWFY